MILTLGIDVGVDGAIAVFDGDGHFVEVWDLPTMEGAIGKQSRRIIEPLQLFSLLQRGGHHDRVAYIERVHAMPLNGCVATFSQGHSLGSVTTVLALAYIPCREIGPKEWKKAVGLPANADRDKKQDKEVARALAIRYYPDAAKYLERKRDHNRADAILIGRYGVSLKSIRSPRVQYDRESV